MYTLDEAPEKEEGRIQKHVALVTVCSDPQTGKFHVRSLLLLLSRVA